MFGWRGFTIWLVIIGQDFVSLEPMTTVLLITLMTCGIAITTGEDTSRETRASAGDPVIFRLDGDFFTPSPGNQIKTWDFPVSNDRVFKRAVVELDVTHGGWWANNADGVHNIFWLTRRGTWRSDTVGYVNLFGPNQNNLKQMTNLDPDEVPQRRPARHPWWTPSA